MSLLTPYDRLTFKLGARPGHLGEVPTVEAYTSADLEYRALMNDAGLVLVNWRSVLHLTGPDTVKFLHNVLTADIKALKPGAVCPATLCDRQGRMQAEFRVSPADDGAWMDTDRHCRDAALAGLARMIIMDRVTVQNLSEEWAALGVYGPHVKDVMPGSLPPTVRAIDDDMLAVPGVTLWAPWAEVESLAGAIFDRGAEPVGAAAWERARIEKGTPRWGAELSDQLLPVEAGMDAAVSYTKGCYIGQEVLLRLRNFGRPVQKLVALAFEGDVKPGAPVTAGGETVGRVTSAVRGRALAIVRKPHYEGGTVQVGGVEARVTSAGAEASPA